MKIKSLIGKLDASITHVRLDGCVASENPRRRSKVLAFAAFALALAFGLPSRAESVNFFVDPSDETLYHVANAAGLGEFRDAVNAGDTFAGKTVVLDGNITLTDASWTPIGSSANPFSGVFNGQGYTISGLKITAAVEGSQMGLFGLVSGTHNASYTSKDSVWINEAFDETNIAEAKYTAVVKNVVLADVSLTNASGDGSNRYTGALVGQAKNAYLKDITVSGSVAGVKGVGGIAGSLDSSVAKSCINSAAVSSPTGYNVGGIAGGSNYASNGEDFCSAFVDCSNSGAVTTTLAGGYAGGIVGMAQNDKYTVIKGCSNSGTIHAVNATAIGGIVGRGINTTLIVDCSNSGALTAENNIESVGGISGVSISTNYRCSNTADITISATRLAGIFNYDKGNGGSAGSCVDCTNSGTLTNTNPDGQVYPIGGDTKSAVYTGRTFADVAEVNALIATLAGNTEVRFENCTVTDKSGTLQLLSKIQRITSDNALCTAVNVASGNATSLVIDIPDAAENIAANYTGLLKIIGDGNAVTVASDVTVAQLTIQGNGSTLDNDGTIGNLTITGDSEDSLSAINDGFVGNLDFGGTGTYYFKNNGTVSRQQSATSDACNQHACSTITACNITIDNYGTIAATANANGASSYVLLFYNNSTVVINCYKGSTISSVKYTLACGSANSVTYNVEDGATFTNGGTAYTPVSSGKLTVNELVVKTYVAQVGETKFETLAAAVEAAKTAGADTVTLLADCTVDSEVVIGITPNDMVIRKIEGTNSVAGGYYTITVKDGGLLKWNFDPSPATSSTLNANIVDQTTAGNGFWLKGYNKTNHLAINGSVACGANETFNYAYLMGPLTGSAFTLNQWTHVYGSVDAGSIAGSANYYSAVTADSISGGNFYGDVTINDNGSIAGGNFYVLENRDYLTSKLADGYVMFEGGTVLTASLLNTAGAKIVRGESTLYFNNVYSMKSYGVQNGDTITVLKNNTTPIILPETAILIVPTDVTYLASKISACDSTHVIKATAIEGGTQYVNEIKYGPEDAGAYLVHGTTTNYCGTVAGAINDATSGDLILLNKDCAEDLTLKIGVTVKLNGKSFTGTYTAHDYGVAAVDETAGTLTERYRTADDSDANVSVNLTPMLYFAKVSAAIASATDGTTIKLLKDIALTDADVQESGGYYYVCGVIGGNNTLIFDGDGHTVTYTGSLACNFATELNNSTMTNVIFTGFKTGVVRDIKGNATFANVKVAGTVEYDGCNWGAFADNSRAKSVTFTDCEMAVDFTAPTTPKGKCHNGAFVGWTEGTQTLNFTRCCVTGNMVCGMAGMFLANISYPKPETSDLAIFTLNVTDCYNEGLITSVYLSNLEEETPYYFNPIVGYSGEDRLSRITVNLKQGEAEQATYTGNQLTSDDLFAALKRNGGEFVNGSRTINVTPETVQEALDNAKTGDTIVLGAGAYDKLYLRQTLANSTRRTDLDKGGSYPAYYRQFKDLTIKVADGANVTCKGIVAEAGLFWYSSAPASNQEAMGRATSGFLSYLELDNIVIDGIAFDTTDGNSCVVLRDNAASSDYCDILVDGFTIQNCTATGDVTNTSLHFFSAGSGTNGKCFPGTEKTALNNIAIKDCTLTNFYQPICHNNASATVNGYTITGNTFDSCCNNLIQMSNGKAAGAWVIANNTTINQSGRFARITNAAVDATFTVTNNTVTTPVAYDEDGSVFKVTGTTGFAVAEKDNAWPAGTVSGGTYISNGDTSLLPVCQIGDVKYATLQAAVDAADATEQTTITVLKDVDYGYVTGPILTSSKNIVLDLNGKTLTGKISSAYVKQDSSPDMNRELIRNYGTMLVTGNGTITITESNNLGWSGSTAIFLNAKSMTIENGTFENNGQDSLSLVIDHRATGSADLTIFGGTFVCPTYTDIRAWQNSTSGNCAVTVSGGTFTGKRNFYLQEPSANITGLTTVDISGGTFTATQRNFQADTSGLGESTTVNVSGGEFSCGDTAGNSVFYLDISYADQPVADSVKALVTGGKFAYGAGKLFDANSGFTDAKKAALGGELSGGVYSGEVESKYLAEGFELVANTDEATKDAYPYTAKKYVAQIGDVKYTSLQAAIYAAEAGETVTLLADVDLAGQNWTPVDFNGTFDGNGKTISNLTITNFVSEYTGFFRTVKGTVKDVTFDGTDIDIKGQRVAVVAGACLSGSAEFLNITVTNAVVKGIQKCGGIVGMVNAGGNVNLTVKNCLVTNIRFVENGTENGGVWQTGGLIGYLGDSTTATIASNTVEKVSIVDAYKAYVDDGNDPYMQYASHAFIGVIVNASKTQDYESSAVMTLFDNTVEQCSADEVYRDVKYNEFCGDYANWDRAISPNSIYPTKLVVDGVEITKPVAKIGSTYYMTLQAAFDAVKSGETVTLLADVTLTEQVNILNALDDLTFDGNGKTITLSFDSTASGNSGLYFGKSSESKWCTGVKIKDLTMVTAENKMARFGIFLCGGTSSTLTNVNISGNYMYAINLYGTHGVTLTDCSITNSLVMEDNANEGGAAIWSNVCSDYPLNLVNSTVGIIGINKYTSDNKLEPKIYVKDGSTVAAVHTYDDGAVSHNKALCVVVEDGGTLTGGVKEYKDSEWVAISYVCQIGDVKYESLAAAIAAVPTAGATATTIQMIADETMAEEASISIANKNIVLDLNGKTISGSGNAQTKSFYLISIGEDATVVIDDSSDEQDGVITMTPTAIDPNYGKESCTIYSCGGTLTLKAGKIVNNATGGAGYAITASSNAWGVPVYSNFSLEGGTVSAPQGDGALRVYVNAGQQISKNYVSISGGTILDKGIFVDTFSYLELSPNMVCDIDITGGTINGLIDLKLRNEVVTMNISGGTFSNSTLRVRNKTDDKSSLITKLTEPAINISGGTFNFASDAFVAQNWAADSANPFKLSGGTYSVEPPAAYVVDGYQVNKVTVDETDRWVVGEIVETGDETTAVVIIDKQTASADVTKKPAAMSDEVAEKVVQNTQVTGVKLVASNETHVVSGAQSVVNVAKETGSTVFASNLEKGTNVVIQVDVEVKPTVYVAPSTSETKEGQVKFNLQPVATVTIDEGGEGKTNKVDVTNEMLDLLQDIVVTVYTGFKPVLAVHTDKSGETIETFNSNSIQYDEATGNATIIVSHFSDVTFFEASTDAVVAECEDKDGTTKSVTIPQQWLLDNGLTAEDATSKTNTVNGLPVWKSYVLGQDPASTVAYNALKVLPQDDGTIDVEIYGFDATDVKTELVTVSYACYADTEVNGSFETKLESTTTTFEDVGGTAGKRFYKNASISFVWKEEE